MSSGRQNFKFKMLVVVVGSAVVVTCFYRALSNKNYETAVVYEDTRPLSFETIGLVIRDERAINLVEKYGASTTIGYTKKDGEHIRMRDRLLTVYKSESGVRVANKIADLKGQRDQLFELTQHVDSIYNSSEILMKSPSDSLLRLVKNVKDMDLGKARESALKILNLINKKQLATGRESGYAKRVADLDSKIRDLEGKKGQTVSESTNFTGCFFKSMDGYESLKASEILTRFPKPNLEELYENTKKQMKTKKDAFGAKIVINYDWYMVALIDEAVAKNILKHKDNIVLNFGFKGGQKVPATPIDYGAAGTPSKQILVFRSNYMNSGLARLRMPKVNISTERIHGLKCPVSAVRFLNGEKGVFVKEGNLIKFKKIKVVYEDESIIISEPVPTDRKYLERLDEVVIKSTNLFEERAL
ncbi:MAG: hypothetical protein LBB04_00555 [Oscillospiraceae bacterium]|jgi:putative membrane fusion protein|nr:hypothetical protein [Oscillospiraceae bacterium]